MEWQFNFLSNEGFGAILHVVIIVAVFFCSFVVLVNNLGRFFYFSVNSLP